MSADRRTQPAVVNYSSDRYAVELRDVEIPQIGAEDVLLEVAAVGVCGSDLHQWTADHSWPVNYPVTLGHEFGGRIAEVGERAGPWNVGDRAVSETAAIIDPYNPLSRAGQYQLDPTRKGFGYGTNGAMTRFVKVPARCLHKVPDNLDLSIACLTEPCCVAYSAVVVNGDVQPGDRILVLGPGPIGLLCAAIAKLQGAIVGVVGLERDQIRFDAVRKYGCQPIMGDCREWAYAADGLGVDGVIDAAGVSATLKTAIDVVRPGGWISKVGWGRDPINFSLDPLVQKNIRLQGSFSHNWPIWERVLRLLSTGLLDLSPMLGGIWPLEDWEEAFKTMHSGTVAKAVLSPLPA